MYIVAEGITPDELRTIAQYATYDKFEERHTSDPRKHPAWEAADRITALEAEITTLRKRVAELEGALEPFKVMADYHDDIDNGFGINRPNDMAVKVHLGHLRRARASLRAKGGEHGE